MNECIDPSSSLIPLSSQGSNFPSFISPFRQSLSQYTINCTYRGPTHFRYALSIKCVHTSYSLFQSSCITCTQQILSTCGRMPLMINSVQYIASVHNLGCVSANIPRDAKKTIIAEIHCTQPVAGTDIKCKTHQAQSAQSY